MRNAASSTTAGRMNRNAARLSWTLFFVPYFMIYLLSLLTENDGLLGPEPGVVRFEELIIVLVIPHAAIEQI